MSTGRAAALEKLRNMKQSGQKNKYEISDECEKIYEMVDEDQYADIVKDRRRDDWIVDDDGSGYVEDGREIFDDEYAEDGVDEAKVEKKSKRKGKSGVKTTGIQSFLTSSLNSKEKSVTLEEEAELFGDVMKQLNSTISTANSTKKTDSPLTSVKKFDHSITGSFGPKPRDAKRTPNPFAISKPDQTATNGHSGSVKSSAKRVAIPDSPAKNITDVSPSKPKPLKSSKFSNSPAKTPLALVTAGKRPVRKILLDQRARSPSPEISVMDDDVIESDADDDALMASFVEEAYDEEPNKVIKEEPMASRGFTAKDVNGQNSIANNVWDDVIDQVEAIKFDRSNDTDAESCSLSQLLTEGSNEKGVPSKVLLMYLMDAYEDHKHPGTVYLFGKVCADSSSNSKMWLSCCVVVKNIERKVFFLPRNIDDEDVLQDVYFEIKGIMEKMKVAVFRVKPTEKQYAFSIADVPRGSVKYMELRYGYDQTALSSELTGETFSHVFGTTNSALETLIVERKLRCPCWINIANPQVSSPPISWAKVEVLVSGEGSISMSSCSLSTPPLTMMAISIKTVLNSKSKQNEIVAIAVLTHDNFGLDRTAPRPNFKSHFCAIAKPNDRVLPFDLRDKLKSQSITTIEVLPNEKALLTVFLAKLQRLDPDLIVGHDILGFDIDVLLHRLVTLKIPQWSRLSRLRRSQVPKLTASKNSVIDATAGRLVCDALIAAKELVRCKSYDLTELSHQILKCDREELTADQLVASFSQSDSLLHAVKVAMTDVSLALKIIAELNAIPLAAQITQIVGGLMSRTFLGGRAERNEYLLLHAFSEKGFICPDKMSFGKKKGGAQASVTPAIQRTQDDEFDEVLNDTEAAPGGAKKKPTYAGGLVLEPKKGFYDSYILLLDFNSLYPSIIQEFNICFTTLPTPPAVKADADFIPDIPDSKLAAGILPIEIKKLVDSRKQVKQLMKQQNISADLHLQYNIRQMALKLTANSMYGCLGFSHSRFFAKHLAALVTAKGREILMHTKELVEKMGLDVIYGDTDSIMINTNSRDMEQTMALGKKIKNEVNKLYRLLELDIDGIFKSMLLLKKKKYAALKLEQMPDGSLRSTQELKGLDVVRRDWCQLAKDAGIYSISEILSDQSREQIVENIHQHLIALAKQVRDGEIPLDKFEVHKQLTKAPADYPDKKNLPHVQVAIRLNEKGGRQYRQGDTIPYVICDDGTTHAAMQRAYCASELQENHELKIDIQYYLAHQIHPVVSRLCDPIEGTDSAKLAECLGLDPSHYHNRVGDGEHRDELDLMAVAGPMVDFSLCEPFQFICHNPKCGQINRVSNPFEVDVGNQPFYSLSKCANSNCTMEPITMLTDLQNQLQLQIIKYVNDYYKNWLLCGDPMCGHRTRRVSLRLDRTTAKPICPACKGSTLQQEYTEGMMFAQLSYLQRSFNVQAALSQLTITEERKKFLKFERVVDSTKETLPSPGPSYQANETLKATVDSWLKSNAYSRVDLGSIFSIFPTKYPGER